ncbi:hypothetical protein [Bradyrhizobium sp.]|uniref:hypothetical protein n=1 Tax=Bradyrhizobium sp. TaxID=376 RepID=UPI003C7246E5
MAKDSDNRVGSFETGNNGGLVAGFLAEEDEFDRRTLWRLGSWAAASVGAVIVALLANQTSIGMRREQMASADLARQSQQIQSIAKESQSEARRLASAIETLNSDRDRLYSRVAVLEQGLDSVTGAIARQNSTVTSPQAASPPASPATTAAPAAPGAAASAEPPATAQKPSPAPVVSPVAATTATTAEKPPVVVAAAEPGPAPVSSGEQAASNAPAAPAATPPTPLVASKSMMAPPDPAAGKLIEPSPPPKAVTAAPMPEVVASTPPAEEVTEAETAAPAPKLEVQRTEFGVDVGGANSFPGLRALWRGLLKSRSNAALTKLRPIIVIKEGNNGLGMQLRLVAGPIDDAAAAAKICAGMIENDRPCATAVFEGQRLAMNADEPATGADAKPQAADIKPASAARPAMHRHYTLKRTAEPAPKPEPSTLSRIFSTR